MNVFEDLVVELKEENLLEDTVIDTAACTRPETGSGDGVLESAELHLESEAAISGSDETGPGPEPAPEPDVAAEPRPYGLANVEPPVEKKPEPPVAESADLQLQGDQDVVEIRKPDNEREFFKKRAVSEISSLQMVEAIISSVERERMKVVPRSYDDLEAKKALHFFLQVADDTESDDHKKAEFDLLRETEAWCSALAARDRSISVENIRRYCENCKPALSSQAMLALARFYRNLPYSEAVRGKFDFIITKLFSRPAEGERRLLLFKREEMLGHIKTLYADWSSIPLYSADEDESNILLTALSFEDLAVEAERALNFDDLIKTDFFGRLRLFKESIAELFFAPTVTAAAIECNVRIGNIYVDLIEREHRKSDAATLHDRYGDIHDQTVSEAAGRTLELVEMLRDRRRSHVDEVTHEQHEVHAEPAHEKAATVDTHKPEAKPDENSLGRRLRAQALGVNRWFLSAAVVIILASVGVFIWANYYAEPNVPTTGVKTLSFQGTEFGEIVKTAKVSGETLYIVAQPTLDAMPKERQTELLQKLYEAGNEKGWINVNLMNSEGKTVGYASPTRMDWQKEQQQPQPLQ